MKGGVVSRYGDVATCQRRMTDNCVAALRARDTGNSAAAVRDCAAAIPSATCDAFEGGTVAACAPKAGARMNGAACTYSAQCQSTFCQLTRGTGCGTCAAPSKAGDACATVTCSRGFTCAANDTCQPDGALSATCGRDLPCGYGLSCVTPMRAMSGTCQTAVSTVGAACDPRRETGPGCAAWARLTCDATSRTCVDEPLAQPGQPCGVIGGVVTGCAGAATCIGASGMTPGSCKALALEGQPCDTTAGPACMSPARCITGGGTATAGTCQLPDATTCG